MNISENCSDAILLDMLKQGSMSAYGQIFSRYYSTLCAYARLYVKSIEECENIVQELMLYLWENHKTLMIRESLPRYLFTATRNRCLKHLDHEGVERKMLDEISNKMHEQFENTDFYVVQELQNKLQQAIQSLPQTYREAFEMNRFQHKTYNEIAAQLHVSPKTIDYRIQQSLKLLRTMLKDYLPLISLLLTSGHLIGGGCPKII